MIYQIHDICQFLFLLTIYDISCLQQREDIDNTFHFLGSNMIIFHTKERERKKEEDRKCQ